MMTYKIEITLALLATNVPMKKQIQLLKGSSNYKEIFLVIEQCCEPRIKCSITVFKRLHYPWNMQC